ncbi:MAG: RNA polymerase sporulation sigma factor SigE [Clostridiales bacterium]|nr:RNA polymerase sporulation sigma factor SigE [Clostridiales bacterium]
MFEGMISRISMAVSRILSGFGRHGQVYYINGANTLPPPLSPDAEAEVIGQLLDESREREARQVLIEHNLRLVVYIAKKFENTGTGIEDLISIGTIGLIKAINTFRADKNIKLATYASRCIENEILMYIRKSSNRHDLSIDEPLSVDWDGNELLLSDILGSDDDDVMHDIEEVEDKKTIRDALSKLDEREQVIISLRYGLGGGQELTQKEVADMMGISQSYISRLEKKILARLGKDLSGKL